MINIKQPLSGKTLMLIGGISFIIGKLLVFLSEYRILGLSIISGLLGNLMAIMGVVFILIGLITFLIEIIKKR